MELVRCDFVFASLSIIYHYHQDNSMEKSTNSTLFLERKYTHIMLERWKEMLVIVLLLSEASAFRVITWVSRGFMSAFERFQQNWCRYLKTFLQNTLALSQNTLTILILSRESRAGNILCHITFFGTIVVDIYGKITWNLLNSVAVMLGRLLCSFKHSMHVSISLLLIFVFTFWLFIHPFFNTFKYVSWTDGKISLRINLLFIAFFHRRPFQ